MADTVPRELYAEAVTDWAARAREATARRDQAVRNMRDAGASLREIAQAAGMAHASIVRILERGQA